MFSEFHTTTYGKWVLAGEHAVLRGNAALAFPLKEKKLNLSYTPNSSLTIECTKNTDLAMKTLLLCLLEYAEQQMNPKVPLTGTFYLDCNIPLGVGLGASAALSLALARWFGSQDLIKDEEILSFAQILENLLHGKSSGMDIAAVAAEGGIYFQQGKHYPLKLAWQPQWYLSNSGEIGITRHCVAKVNAFWEREAKKAEAVDNKMHRAVEKSLQALNNHQTDSRVTLQKAIEEAADCFQDWGLVTPSLHQHMTELKAEGALAVKPTGSGGGGYVLSLWGTPPATMSAIDFIKL